MRNAISLFIKKHDPYQTVVRITYFNVKQGNKRKL